MAKTQYPELNSGNCLNGCHKMQIDTYRLGDPDNTAESLISWSCDFISLLL